MKRIPCLIVTNNGIFMIYWLKYRLAVCSLFYFFVLKLICFFLFYYYFIFIIFIAFSDSKLWLNVRL